MLNQDKPAIRSATFALLLTQSLASAALITSTTVNPLVMAQLSGQDVLAGLPSAIMLEAHHWLPIPPVASWGASAGGQAY